MRRFREWWHWFVRRNFIADDPMDDERLRWQAKMQRHRSVPSWYEPSTVEDRGTEGRTPPRDS